MRLIFYNLISTRLLINRSTFVNFTKVINIGFRRQLNGFGAFSP